RFSGSRIRAGRIPFRFFIFAYCKLRTPNTMIKANDPHLHSWITIAPSSEFPIQNLPFGIFRAGLHDPRVGVAIGDYVLDLYALSQFGYFENVDIPDHTVLFRDTLNHFIALGKPVWRQTRERVSQLLRHDNT
ncbi:MAG TPA: hypothetical protein VK927_08805, partial [Adhaeribacter sp.]|nr:hypothetical protein [Adhaeribacter sp.]